jgi:hypothetical protein
MLGPDYWNVGTSLLFGMGFRPPVSTRCSPATPCCTCSWYSITSKLYLVPHRGRVQRVGVLPSFRESSPSSKLLQAQHSTIWWTDTCPWHGLKTTLRLHSSTMLGACLPQPHDAIYSQSRTSGSWWSVDTVTTWSWDLQTCARLKAMTLLPCLATSLSLVHQWCLSPTTESHVYSNPLDPWAVRRFFGWQENLRPLLTGDPAVYKIRQSLTMCQRAVDAKSAPRAKHTASRTKLA